MAFISVYNLRLLNHIVYYLIAAGQERLFLVTKNEGLPLTWRTEYYAW
jgi:hypothetical protein